MLSSLESAVPSPYPRLASRQHPLVRRFRGLARDRRDGAGVLLDGLHLIEEAARAGVPLPVVLVTRACLTKHEREMRSALAASGHSAAVYEVSDALMAAASPVRTPSGIAAIAEWTPAPVAATLQPAPALAIAIHDVQDPGNVGAVVRSADALGATGVIALDRTADPGGWKALRGAMGSAFRLPVARASLDQAIAEARAKSIRIIATSPGEASPVHEADLASPVLVLLGHEGEGLPPSVLALADTRVTVPMRAGVNSLNVAATAAIILYEAARQRRTRNR